MKDYLDLYVKFLEMRSARSGSKVGPSCKHLRSISPGFRQILNERGEYDQELLESEALAMKVPVEELKQMVGLFLRWRNEMMTLASRGSSAKPNTFTDENGVEHLWLTNRCSKDKSASHRCKGD